MVDSRDKGMRTEIKVRDELRSLTGLKWERTPLSGALNAVHGLKADLYIPNEHNIYSVEVKGYADDHLTSKILTDKEPQIESWWNQATRQAGETNKLPLLVFKHDRGKLFSATNNLLLPLDEIGYRFMYIHHLKLYISKLDDFVKLSKPEWIRT